MSRHARGRRPVRGAAGLVVAGGLALALVPAAAAQERFRRTAPLPDSQRLELRLPRVETFSLPNGLTVATARRPGSPVITLQLVVRAGEADSPPTRPGLALVAARMVGQGTKILSAENLRDMIEAIGADYAVDVFMDYTVLTLRVTGDWLDRAIYILRLIALESTFGEKELSAVRRTTYWELIDRKKDPEVLGWRQLFCSLFENHPYRIAVYNEDVIKFITLRDVAGFYGRFYRPANAAVLVSGDIDPATVAQRVGNHFGAWTGGPPERTAPPPPPANDGERVCFVEEPEAEAATVFAGNLIMGSASPDFYPFLVVKQILGGTTWSRLFMNLRESRGFATYAFSEMEVFGACGVYWARARVRPEVLAPAVAELLGEIGAMAAGPAVPSEVEEAKSYLIGSLPLRFESPEGFGDWLARYVALGLGPDQWDEGAEEIKLVNAERVRETARKYLTARPVLVVVGRPEWLEPYLGDLAAVEVYDAGCRFKHVRAKGEGR